MTVVSAVNAVQSVSARVQLTAGRSVCGEGAKTARFNHVSKTSRDRVEARDSIWSPGLFLIKARRLLPFLKNNPTSIPSKPGYLQERPINLKCCVWLVTVVLGYAIASIRWEISKLLTLRGAN